MKSQKIQSILQRKLPFLLALIVFAGSNLANGQTNTKSAFEIKVDDYLKLYLANFNISSEKAAVTGKQFSPDKLTSLTWSKQVTLVSKTTIEDRRGRSSNLKLYLSFYHFDDSRQCKAAMDSLLNCFGNECMKIQWAVPGQSVNTDPVIFIFNEKEIICCRVACDQENDYWHRFTPDLVKSFRENSSGIMESGCGGPVTFNKN